MIDQAKELLRHSRVKVTFGHGALRKLGAIAAELGGTRILLVTDPGILAAGYPDRAAQSLREAGLEVTIFHGVKENPTTGHVAAGVNVAKSLGINLIVGLGGGSAMDAAKGINFILTNGGRMQDYWGVGKATKPMLPLVAIPTTAGTGSEAQSFALITDPQTHQKMACGDPKALPAASILDPDLTTTMPHGVAAATGIDAIAHAVETSACNKRTDVSRQLSHAAWELLSNSYENEISNRTDDAAREKMLLGAHLAGMAIEKSMLGAAHSCANPLTAEFDIVHGIAVGLLLPHVVRFNASSGENPYSDLVPDAAALAAQLDRFLVEANLPRRLRDLNVPESSLPAFAESAAKQWTANFNPRRVGVQEMHEIYRSAY